MISGCGSSDSKAAAWINATYTRSEIEFACENTQPNTAGLDWYPEIGFTFEELNVAWREECQQFGQAAEEPAPEEEYAYEPQAAEEPAPEEEYADEQVSSCGGDYRYDNELPISVCSESASVALFQDALGVEPDGYFGPGTQTALIMLQDRAGLPITRRIDAATWAHLGVTANAPYDDLNGDGVIDASEFPG